jgi:hypothetical protein
MPASSCCRTTLCCVFKSIMYNTHFLKRPTVQKTHEIAVHHFSHYLKLKGSKDDVVSPSPQDKEKAHENNVPVLRKRETKFCE